MSFKHPPLAPDSAPFDDENPEWTDDMFAKAGTPDEVLPPEIAAAFKRPRGRPRAERPKVAVKLRLDQAIIDHFKDGGPGWQTRINEALAGMLGKGR